MTTTAASAEQMRYRGSAADEPVSTESVSAAEDAGAQAAQLAEKAQDAARKAADKVTKNPASLAYSLLLPGFVLLTAVLWTLPDKADDFFFGPPRSGTMLSSGKRDPMEPSLTKVWAATLFFVSSLLYAVQQGAVKNRLSSSLYQRLNLDLGLWAAVALGIAVFNKHVFTPHGFLSLAALLSATIVAAGSQLLAGRRGAGVDPSQLASKARTAARQLTEPSSLRERGYALLTLGFTTAGLALIFTPNLAMRSVLGRTGTEAAKALWQLCGIGDLSIPIAAWSLKDILADKRRVQPAGTTGTTATAHEALGRRNVFRILNLGLTGAALGHVLTMGPLALGNKLYAPAYPLLTAAWVLTLVVGAYNSAKSL